MIKKTDVTHCRLNGIATIKQNTGKGHEFQFLFSASGEKINKLPLLVVQRVSMADKKILLCHRSVICVPPSASMTDRAPPSPIFECTDSDGVNSIFYEKQLSHICPDYTMLVKTLEQETSLFIFWFQINCLQTNPEEISNNPFFHNDSASITCEETIKLAGIEMEYQLNFDTHIRTISGKASQQLHVLKRIGKSIS